MARTLASSRKRKRESDVSIPAWEGDTIEVLPRRTVASKGPSERTPLKETSTRGNRASRKRVLSRVEISLTPTSPESTKELPRASAQMSDETVPSDCCYHCRTRGGNAAYECFKEDGEERCTRCIRDKKGKCRMPTDEEAIAIAARCPYCIRRGFKNCNGGFPCDTCIRNKTPNACQQPLKKKVKPENSSARSVRAGESSRDDRVEVANRPSRTRRTRRSEPAEHSQTEQVEQLITVEDTVLDVEFDHSADNDGRLHYSLALPQHPKNFTESSIQEILESQEATSLTPSAAVPTSLPDFDATIRDQSLAVANTFDEDATAKEISGVEESTTARSGTEDCQDVMMGSNELPPIPVSHGSTPEKDVLMDETSTDDNVAVANGFQLQQRRGHAQPSDSSARPRRSRARVSYVEVHGDDLSDQGRELEDESDADAYISPTTDDESEMDEESELVFSADETWADSDEDTPKDMVSEQDEIIGEVVQITTKSSKPRKSGKSSTTIEGKGIDLSLPPLSNIYDIFADLAEKAKQLGLCKVLERLDGRPIRVATMCSGTESPLLAFELLSKALEETGMPPIVVKHCFSAEIEVVKQGYIERNFQPAILFRDVREFIREGATTATTAYGAEMKIPDGLDILIAGFVCKDLSRMNSNRKGLDSDGESGDTWRAIYNYAKHFRPRIVLLENVKAQPKIWKDLVSEWDKIGYEATSLILDTKNYYLPQTRQRMYMIAIERSLYGKDTHKAASQWEHLMQSLKRQCSSPYEAFLTHLRQESNTHSALLSEHDWALCKLRYDRIRSKELLGIQRTITKWNENGTIRPPDFADRKWYRSQSSRVFDAIEVAHLLFARMGLDSLYKMAAWDVSQNVDRFNIDVENIDKVTTNLGIVPCITPDGCDFATNRHRALNGSQLLVLQGMPLDKLMFARETQKDRQDLAGNAMSTTVIGASIISAIICGLHSLKPQTQAVRTSEAGEMSPLLSATDSIRPGPMRIYMLQPDSLGQLDIAQLLQDAVLSSRLCNCEGIQDICNAPIQICSSCEHTACSICAGNPKHTYVETISAAQRTMSPDDFVKKWKRHLPARLTFYQFPDIRQMVPTTRTSDSETKAYVDWLDQVDVASQYFCMGELRREDNVWKVAYTSSQATLEVRIGRDLQWLLFVKCPPGLPGNDCLRKMFEQPVAHATNSSEWRVFIPRPSHFSVHMSGSIESTASWRNRLGFPDCKAETVPMKIDVQSQEKEVEAVVGEYEFLPYCGTASSSLYKRTIGSTLYMFLDPNPLGASKDDSLVFSHDCSRKHYGDIRITTACLEPSWRPWLTDGDVSVSFPGLWVPAAIELGSAGISVTARVPQDGKSFEHAAKSCSHAGTILDVELPEKLSVQKFSDYSWALEPARLLPSFSEWQTFDSSNLENCTCAPPYPRILWHVDSNGVATAHEDRKAAARFERAIKTRKPILQISPSSVLRKTQIQVELNIASLCHRARSNFAPSAPIASAWRLIVDHTDLVPRLFPKFRLQSNSSDTLDPPPPGVGYLRGNQPRSLAWMKSQELGKPLTITEVEEAVQADLGWRAEARAQTTVTVRGGVLADLPSFGKTVTTIALIQSEFEQISPETLLNNNRTLASQLPDLEHLAATLIVCPPHIAKQWQSELEKFLGAARFELYNVLLVQSFTELQALTIEDFRQCRIVILSWSIFTDEEYIQELAQFTGMPKPAATSRRAFDVWLDRVVHDIPSRISALHTMEDDYEEFQRSSTELLQERLKHEDFQVALPLKLQHGSAYQSYNTMQAAANKHRGSGKRNKPQLKRKASSNVAKTRPIPLLHLFRFNRVVVDEYHYLNDDKKISNVLASVAVKHVAAIKRWVLSGTPALANFSDIDQIASFLGVKLGRYYCGNGSMTTQLERARRAEQTHVEDFLAQTEIMSQYWHQARHDCAQKFLGQFVRQNEPSLEHVACSEVLIPVELDIAHHAIYLELSQHLISQKMQIKKLSKKSDSDRADRLTASLNESATAEEALLKSALLFETKDGESGLDQLRDKRSTQRRDTEEELLDLLVGFEGRKSDKEMAASLQCFKDDIQKNWLGDADATESIRRLLVRAAKHPNSKAFPHLRVLEEKKRSQEIRKVESQLRVSARELTLRTRSERFLSTVEGLLPKLQAASNPTCRCSSSQCKGSSKISGLYIVSHCGHTACEGCLKLRVDEGVCVDPQCTVPVQDHDLIKVCDLGSTKVNVAEHSFGRKLDAVAQLIEGLENDDQVLIFAPTEQTVTVLEDVLDHYDITYHSPSKSRAAARIIEDFKNNTDPDERRKVLILNLGSESAAGINLVNANHIIFISPLLTKSQYEYDSAMVQAIARSRRYGQQKKVHIYHVVAQRTIDVDILEHRHKRYDGITTSTSTMRMPEPSGRRKEKTKLIQNNAGHMALVPGSWLADESKRRILDVEEAPGSFTSLINFSETFEHEED